jgi:hypothetical protein
MEKEHDKLFADPEAFNEEQIEVGLAAGVWSEQVRPLVQYYLYELKLKRIEAIAEQHKMQMAMQAGVEEAANAKMRATIAFILGGGAMLAAMGAAFIAFLALRRYGFQPPW